jgi:DNA replication protein DnaC
MKSDDDQLKELAADLTQRRESVNALATIPIREIPPATETRPRITEEQREQQLKLNAAHGYARELVQARGARYAQCTLTNFACPTDAQAQAVERLVGYCRKAKENASDGVGVFLFGASGTGKDHLAMGVAKAFIYATSKPVVWISGAMLFEKLRDSFDGKKSESEVLGRYASASLLWLSDPIPVKGELTQYQAEALYRLVDERYNQRRPVLVTANIGPGGADAAMGPAIARRLRESTIQVHCNWDQFKP